MGRARTYRDLQLRQRTIGKPLRTTAGSKDTLPQAGQGTSRTGNSLPINVSSSSSPAMSTAASNALRNGSVRGGIPSPVVRVETGRNGLDCASRPRDLV